MSHRAACQSSYSLAWQLRIIIKEYMNRYFSHIFTFFVLLTLAGIPGLLSSCKTARQSNTDNSQPEQFVTATDTCFHMPAGASAEVYRNLNPVVYDFYKSRNFAMYWHNPAGSHPDAMTAVIQSVRLYGLVPQDYHIAEINDILENSDCESRFKLDALLTDALFRLSSHVNKGRLKPIAIDSALLQGDIALKTADDIRTYLASREPQYEGYKSLRSALALIYDTLDAASYSIPAQQAIKTLEINLERWRWEDSKLGPDYVWVNIPAFEVTVIGNGEEVIRSKAIVGTPRNQTPTFSSAIECFTVYPYWHVPRSIAVGEYLPAIKKNISFIPLNNLEVLDQKGNILRYDTLPWHTYNRNYFPVSLRQREGVDNALGVVKFQFDNPYSVYLHDTNAKGLFRYENRARSHGCIRMEKAIEFALYLAGHYTKYSPSQISKYLDTKTMRRIDLDQPLPIHIRYFTAEYDGESLKIYNDVYGRDKELLNQFYQATPVMSEKKPG
ncbi:MAG TPA: L,D-transpeptidase family protein [Cyclobacteriaceae bacterium]